MPHGMGTTLTTLAVAVTAGLAPTAIAPIAAQADAHDAVVTVTDGCGRVDSLEVDKRGDYWIEAWPDGKAPKPEGKGDGLTSRDKIIWQRSLIPMSGTSWTRPVDSAKAYTSVRVAEWDDDLQNFVYLPLISAFGPDGVRGTEMFKLTNEDCVQPEEPVFTDEAGSTQDTVTIPSVTGVKYSGKPGTTPGKGTMTVTATADKGYRLATPDGAPLPGDKSRWSYTFDGTAPVEVPEDKAPTFRMGDPIPATKSKPAGRGPNIVTVRHVPGVTWVVDGKQVKTADKTPVVDVPVGDKVSVEVQATSADPKSYALAGTTEWVVGNGAVTRAMVAPLTTAVAKGASTVVWRAPAGFPSTAHYHLRYRVITLTRNGVRARTTWRPWLIDTPTRQSVLRAKPGSIVEVQAQATAGRRSSGWSAPATVWFPLDVTAPRGKTWKVAKERSAFGGTMLTTTARAGAWTTRTPVTGQVMLWFGTSPTGAPAAIFVDGKRVATVNTRSSSTKVRQVLRPVPVLWGRHTVTVVHAGKNGQTLRLDAASYSR